MKRNSRSSFLSVLIICSLLLVSNLQLTKANDETTVSTIINTDTTWTQEGSPYVLTNTIQISENSTLTIEPGVTISFMGTSDMFLVQGGIMAQGTSDSLIVFNGGGTTNFFKGTALDESFNFSYCRFQEGNRLFNLPGGHSQVLLRHCEVRNIVEYSFLNQLETENYIEYNAFINSAGFSIYDWWESPSEPLTYSIQYNLVYGNIDFFVDATCNRQNTVISANYNSFINSDNEPVLRLGGSYGISAQNNYWETTDNTAIEAMIYDNNDDVTIGGAMQYQPILLSPDPKTPTYVIASNDADGSISPDGVIPLNYGTDQAFTMTPNSGYHISDVLVNGTSVGSSSAYTIENISGATTISVMFEADQTTTPTSSPTTTSPTSQSSPTIPELPSSSFILLFIALLSATIVLRYQKIAKHVLQTIDKTQAIA